LKALVDEVLGTASYREKALAMKAEIAKVDGLGMAADLIERAFGCKPSLSVLQNPRFALSPVSAR
jgi:UDP:flavonoid glycosyltransferase YjiC (YdhE family)